MGTLEKLERLFAELEARLADREATLDAISYKCADFDSGYSQADSMLDVTGMYIADGIDNVRTLAFEHGRERAGTEIDKIITASGYKVKPRPEED